MRDLLVKANSLKFKIQEYEHQGEAIIFLHFSGANLMMWQRAVPYFQDSYRLILVDMRGHGKSDKPETGYHMDTLAADVIGIMDEMGIEKAHIVGSSMGAEVGLSLAANHPERVISLVCDGALSSEFGPYSTWEGSEEEFEAMAKEQVESFRVTPPMVYPSMEALMERTRQVFTESGIWNEYTAAMEEYTARKLEDGTFTKCFRGRTMANYFEDYFHYRLEDYYRRITCPLLLLPGEDVMKNEPEKIVMEGLQALAPRAEIAVVPGWEHPYGWLLDPDGACQAIVRFYESIAETR